MGASNFFRKALSFTSIGSDFAGTGRNIFGSRGGIDQIPKEEKAKEEAARREQEAITKEKQRVEKEKQQLIVKQSKTAQAGQERRKTIFAGGLGNAGNINIFKKTLG